MAAAHEELVGNRYPAVDSPPVDRLAAAAQQLAATLTVARSVQWDKAATTRPRGEQRRGDGGRPSDPTADTALDDRRLALSSAVKRADMACGVYAASLSAHVSKVADALSAWEGDN